MVRGFVFGPVFSRRLGISLGVDIIPPKVCSYDCIYCEVGPTTFKTSRPAHFFDPDPIINEVLLRLKGCQVDVVTLGGSGEPTLNTILGTVARELRHSCNRPLALLTNGSLLWREDVLSSLSYFDIILPTFSAFSQETFQRLHHPHSDIDVEMVKEGLLALKGIFLGEIWVELMLVKGINDNQGELSLISNFLERISPSKVQVTTVERPPAYKEGRSVDDTTLNLAKQIIGHNAQIITSLPSNDLRYQCNGTAILLETLKRRPVRVSEALGLLKYEYSSLDSLWELERTLGISKVTQNGQEFYIFEKKG